MTFEQVGPEADWSKPQLLRKCSHLNATFAQILECHIQSGSPLMRSELKTMKTPLSATPLAFSIDFPSGLIDALVKFFDGTPLDDIVSNAAQLRSLHSFADVNGFDGLRRALDGHVRHELIETDPLGVFAFAVGKDDKLAKKAMFKLGERFELCKTSDAMVQAMWPTGTICMDSQHEYVACIWREKKSDEADGEESSRSYDADLPQQDAIQLFVELGLPEMMDASTFAAVLTAFRKVEYAFATDDTPADTIVTSKVQAGAEIHILGRSLGRVCWEHVKEELEGEPYNSFTGGFGHIDITHTATRQLRDPWM